MPVVSAKAKDLLYLFTMDSFPATNGVASSPMLTASVLTLTLIYVSEANQTLPWLHTPEHPVRHGLHR